MTPYLALCNFIIKPDFIIVNSTKYRYYITNYKLSKLMSKKC